MRLCEPTSTFKEILINQSSQNNRYMADDLNSKSTLHALTTAGGKHSSVPIRRQIGVVPTFRT